MKFGYARISTLEQNLNLQTDALTVAGCEEIITDEVSGSSVERPGLNKLLEKLRNGDELIVWRLDRLGRTIRHLIELINNFNSRGIIFRSLTENIETSTNNGRLIFNIFASLAEFERNLIRERTMAGLNAARARGKKGGRKPKETSKIEAAIQLYNKRELTVEQICKAIGLSRGTLYKYIK
ncbi:MAG: recombinase family protein [Burkholderiales bacterium]